MVERYPGPDAAARYVPPLGADADKPVPEALIGPEHPTVTPMSTETHGQLVDEARARAGAVPGTVADSDEVAQALRELRYPRPTSVFFDG